MTEENFDRTILDKYSEEIEKFASGFSWELHCNQKKECRINREYKKLCDDMHEAVHGKISKKERGLMIRDYCEWREKQEPFVDDKEFFVQNYGVNPDPILQDLFKEIYLLRKELDELQDECE